MTEPLLVIRYLGVRKAYEWFCRRCNHTAHTAKLSKAEADGFAHVKGCRG